MPERKTQLPPAEEQRFQKWYAGWSKQLDLDPDPDDPQHFYDYRGAFRAGAEPDADKHWPSEFKLPGHPNRFVGGMDTMTGQPGLSDDQLSALIRTNRLRGAMDRLTDDELTRVVRLSKQIATGGGPVSDQARERLAGLQAFEPPPTTGPGLGQTGRDVRALVGAPSEALNRILAGTAFPAAAGQPSDPSKIRTPKDLTPSFPVVAAKTAAATVETAKEALNLGKFILMAQHPASRENAIAASLAKNLGAALIEPAVETVKAFGRTGGLERLQQEQPMLMAQGMFDLATLPSLLKVPSAVKALNFRGLVDDAFEAAFKSDDMRQAAGLARATEKTVEELAQATAASRAIGHVEAAEDLAARGRDLERMREQLLAKVAPTTEKELEVLKAAPPVEVPPAPIKAAGPGAQSGQIDRELLIRLGGSTLGAGVAEGLRQASGADENGFSAGDALLLLAGAASGFKLADPKFRDAIRTFGMTRKQYMDVLRNGNIDTDLPSFERIFQTYLEPLFPEKITGKVAVPAMRVGAAAGLGVLGGSVAEEDRFSIPGAIAGVAAGAALGGFAFRNPEDFAKMFREGFSPRKTFQQWFTESKGLPPDFVQFKRINRDRLAGMMTQIKDAVDATEAGLRKYSPARASEIGEQMQMAMAGKVGWEAIPDEGLRELAKKMRHTFDELSTGIVASGLEQRPEMVKIILDTNYGRYVPTKYLYWENQEQLTKAQRFLSSRSIDIGDRVSARNYLKHKSDDMTPEMKEMLGEILDSPHYLLGKQGPITAADIAFANQAKFVLSSPDFAIGDDIISAVKAGKDSGVRLFNRHGVEMAERGGETFRKMSSNPRLGILKNQYVLENIADDMDTALEIPGQLSKIMQKTTALFKAGKVTLNPGTLMRNIFGIFLMNDVGAGLSPANVRTYKQALADFMVGADVDKFGRPIRRASRAVREAPTPALKVGGKTLIEKSGPGRVERYLEARKDGLWDGDWVGTEIADILKPMERGEAKTALGSALKWFEDKALAAPLKSMARFHQASEQFSRMALYNYARDTMHLDSAQAVRFAKRNGFDYQDVPRYIDVSRKHIFGAPFITFAFKALPRIAESAVAVRDPRKMWRFWKYPLMFGAVNEYSMRQRGIVEDNLVSANTLKRIVGTGLGFAWGEYGKIKKLLPDYAGAQQVFLPGHRDNLGRFSWLDMTYNAPWGDVGEFGKGTMGKQLAKMNIPFPRQLEPGNPILGSFVGLYTGRDPFTGQEIISPESTPAGATLDYLRFVARQFLPTLTPGVGFSARKIQRSLKGDPNVPRPVPTILTELGGVRLNTAEGEKVLGMKSIGLKKRILEDQTAISKMSVGLSIPEQKQISAFIAGEVPITSVPRALRGKAKRAKRIVEGMEKAVQEFESSIPAAFKKAR